MCNMRPLTPEITINADAWATVLHEVASANDGLETGGILLGHDNGDTITITSAGSPGPNAHRTPDRFLRDLNHANQLAADAWERDRSQWVGEWHTHPHSPPVPSEIDLDSYATHLRDPDLGFMRFISVIIGLAPNDEAACATWLITPAHAKLVPLRNTEDLR